MTEIVCACVHECMRVCVNIDVFLTLLYYHDQDASPAIGSFHVKSTDGFHGPPPILLKFGTLVGIV